MSDYVWGIDPASGHVAFAFAPENGDTIHTETLITRTDSFAAEGQRLGWLDRQVRTYVTQIERRYPPACVFVERAVGHRGKTPLLLTQATGVIIAAVYEALGGTPVFEMNVAKWKKATVGRGNATKEQIAAFVAEHATVDNQDEADAYCIALAGRDLLARSRKAAA